MTYRKTVRFINKRILNLTDTVEFIKKNSRTAEEKEDLKAVEKLLVSAALKLSVIDQKMDIQTANKELV